MAPPIKLNKKVADSIIAEVQRGLFDAQIALKHGIDVVTLKSWVDRGIDEEAEEPFKSFAERYIKAAIALEESHIAVVFAAAHEYIASLESVEHWIGGGGGGGDGDGAVTEIMPGGSRKTKRMTQTMRGDWKASAWYLERRWPLRWGITRQPAGGPKEAIILPDAPTQRRKKVEAMVTAPPPELIKALRAAGFELVRKEAKT